MRGKVNELPFIKVLSICPSRLFETFLNKAKYSIYEKLSGVFSVAGFRFNSSTSDRPFFSYTESPCTCW